MALSAFADKSNPPGDEELKTTLGKAFAAWQQLQERVAECLGPVAVEWGYASKSTGWGLRLKQPKRTILYMTPCKGHFLVSFALGEKAVAAAHAAKLPRKILDAIDEAPKYAEGRGVRFEVRNAREVSSLIALAEIKMAQ